MAESRLIITADDFGADVAVNEAVEIAHRRGVLTAASLMVSAPAATDAVARARAMPGLGVGLHLVLVDGRPTLPARSVPLLVDRSGAFQTDMAVAGATMFFHPGARRQLRAEIHAQFAAFAATGLPLDHVNAHKHFHMHPTIAGFILEAGAKFGLRSVRAPIEPGAVLDAVEPGQGGGRPSAFRLLARGLGARLRRAGLSTPDQVFGLGWSGAMTAERLAGLIDRLPPGLNEIYLHPATADRYPGSARGYRYTDELSALLAPTVRAATERPGVRTGRFADFAGAPA